MECWSFPPRYDDTYTPPPDQPHWFPERETMDPAERDALILERLREVCAYALERAPFYRRKWGEFDPRTDLRSLEDFERLPVIEKDELRADQAEHPPFGSYTCIEPEDVEELKQLGVDEIMGQDTPPDAIVDLVRNMVAERGAR